MMRRCLGRTKSFQRCAREVGGRFCADHRWQVPVAIISFILAFFTFFANYATVSQFAVSFFKEPRVEISLGKLDAKFLKTDPIIPIKVDPNGWVEIDFAVKNTGNAPVQRPVVAVHSMPDSVLLVRVNGKYDPSRPNATQFSGDTADLQPFATYQTSYKFTVRAKIPREVQECSLSFRVYGDNLATVQQKVRFKIEI